MVFFRIFRSFFGFLKIEKPGLYRFSLSLGSIIFWSQEKKLAGLLGIRL